MSRFCHDREADIAVAEIGRDLGEPTHLRRRQLADRQHDADPVQPRLFLRVHTDMRGAGLRGTRLQCVGCNARELAPELLLDQRQEFLEAEIVEHVFEPRLGPVGAIAVVDEDAHDRVGHGGCFRGFDHNAGVAGEIMMTGDAAEHETKPNARLNSKSVGDFDRLEANVVGVLEHRNDAAAVEPDIELAGNAVERAIIENVEVPLACVGPRVDEFLRIDAGRRRAGDIANVVGAGPARAEPEILDRLHHGDRIARLDLADLQIGARRHVGVAAAITARRDPPARTTASA